MRPNTRSASFKLKNESHATHYHHKRKKKITHIHGGYLIEESQMKNFNTSRFQSFFVVISTKCTFTGSTHLFLVEVCVIYLLHKYKIKISLTSPVMQATNVVHTHGVLVECSYNAINLHSFPFLFFLRRKKIRKKS